MMLGSLEATNKDVMNKPRILMLRLNGVICSALSRGLPTWREKLSVGIIAFAVLLGIALMRDVHQAERNGRQAESAYWQKPLTCSGPEFRAPPLDPGSAPDEPRSIFKMSDHMVLSIPRHYLGWPWDENLPATIAHCGSISDLPQIQHLYIRIKGRWSGTYDVRELPRDNNGDLEYPDIAGLHVLPPDVRPAWAAQKPIRNRAFITTSPFQPVTTMQNGFLCHGNGCWFPVPRGRLIWRYSISPRNRNGTEYSAHLSAWRDTTKFGDLRKGHATRCIQHAPGSHFVSAGSSRSMEHRTA